MTMFKKLSIVFILLLLLGALSVSAVADTDSDRDNKLGLDLIVILDNSFSLSQGVTTTPSDPNGYRFDAVAAAINLCDAETSRVNYILFNNNVYVYSNGKMTQITSKNSLALQDVSLSFGRSIRMQLLNDLTANDKIHAQKTSGGSDIGIAMETAVNTLIQSDNGNKKVIILLVDGGISLKNNNLTNAQVQRQETKSYDTAVAARDKAEENGITIHTLLLKDSSALGLVQNDLRTSDGTFMMVTDPEQLPGCFTKIIANDIQSDTLAANGTADSSSGIIVNVPNSSVSEMSVFVPVGHIDASTLQLVSPSGKVLENNASSGYYAASSYLAFYKVISPEPGDWMLAYTGDGSSNIITAQYVLSYELDAEASLSSNSIGKNQPLTINAYYAKNGVPVSDVNLYSIPAIATMKREDGTVVKTYSMTGSEHGYVYTIESVTGFAEGNYSISVQFDGDGLIRSVDGLGFAIANNAPALVNGENGNDSHSFTINTPGVEESYAVQSCTWNLSNLIYDPDGDKLQYTIVSAPPGISASITGSTLTVSTIKDTTADGNVIVSVTDSDGAVGPTLTFHITVESTSATVDTIVYGPMASLTKTNDTATIKVQYSVDGSTITSGSYYNIPASLTLKKDGKVLRSGVAMEYDGNAYTCTLTELKQYGAGEFEADIRLQSGSFLHDCTPVTFTLTNIKPVMAEDISNSVDCTFEIDNPEDQGSYKVQTKTYDLANYVVDPDGDALIWSIKSNDADVKAAIVGSTLSITTKKSIATSGNLVVSVIDVDGDEGPDVTFNIVVTSVESTIGVTISGPTKAQEKDTTIEISAQLTQNGISVAKDSSLYSIPATMTVVKGSESIYKALPMVSEAGIYTGTIPSLAKYGSGDYMVIISFAEGNFHLSSDPFVFKLTNSAPVLSDGITNTVAHEFQINNPEDVSTYQAQTWNYDLNTLVSDPNGDNLTWTVAENTADVSATIVDSNLTVVTKKGVTTEGDITISVSDAEGVTGPDIKIHVTVVSVESVIGIMVSGPNKATTKETPVVINAQYTRSGKAVQITDGLNTIPMTISVFKDGEALESDVAMVLEGDSYSYTFTNLQQYHSGDYNVVVQSEKENFKVSGETSFALTNSAPVLSDGITNTVVHEFQINNPEDVSTYQAQTWNYDLNTLVSDPNGDNLTWTVAENTADVSATIVGSNLTVVTKKGITTEGDITISVSDAEGVTGPSIKIHITVVSVESAIGITVTGPNNTIAKETPVIIKAQYTRAGKAVQSTDELNTIPMMISIFKEGEALESDLVMSIEGDSYSYTFNDLQRYRSGNYEVVVRAEKENFKVSSETFVFKLSNDSPILSGITEDVMSFRFDTNIPGKAESYRPQTQTFSLDTLVTDPNGDALTWTIKENTANIKAQITDNELKVTTIPNTVTNGKIIIGVVDDEGEAGPTLNFNVSVISIEAVYDQYTAKFISIEKANKNSDVTLSLKVYDETGARVDRDSYLPDEIIAIVTDGDKNTSVKMTRDEDGNYAGIFHTGVLSSEYQVNAEVSVGEKSIKADPITLQTYNKAPIVTEDISAEISTTILLGLSSDKTIDLKNFFRDPDGDELTYTITDNSFGDHADISVSDGILTIHAKSALFCIPLNGSFTITAVDTEEAAVVSAVVSITIWPVIWIALVVLIIIGAIAAVILYLSWKKKHFENAAFAVSYGYMGLELPDSLSDPLPFGGRKPVTLDLYYTEQAASVVQNEIPATELRKVVIRPMAKGQIQILVQPDLNAPLYDGKVVYTNGKYTGENQVNKSITVKIGNEFSLCKDMYSLTFRLVKIKKNH